MKILEQDFKVPYSLQSLSLWTLTTLIFRVIFRFNVRNLSAFYFAHKSRYLSLQLLRVNLFTTPCCIFFMCNFYCSQRFLSLPSHPFLLLTTLLLSLLPPSSLNEVIKVTPSLQCKHTWWSLPAFSSCACSLLSLLLSHILFNLHMVIRLCFSTFFLFCSFLSPNIIDTAGTSIHSHYFNSDKNDDILSIFRVTFI